MIDQQIPNDRDRAEARDLYDDIKGCADYNPISEGAYLDDSCLPYLEQAIARARHEGQKGTSFLKATFRTTEDKLNEYIDKCVALERELAECRATLEPFATLPISRITIEHLSTATRVYTTPGTMHSAASSDHDPVELNEMAADVIERGGEFNL